MSRSKATSRNVTYRAPSEPRAVTTSIGSRKLPRLLLIALALDEQPAVDPDARGSVEAGAHEHRGPVDRVEAVDVLADHVQVGRPPLSRTPPVVGEAGARDVVDERVVPDVDRARLAVPRAVLALRRTRRSRRSGTGSPSAGASRLIEKSSRPPRMNPSISLRRYSGCTQLGVLLVVRAAAGPGRPRAGRTSCAP